MGWYVLYMSETGEGGAGGHMGSPAERKEVITGQMGLTGSGVTAQDSGGTRWTCR